MSEVTLYHGDCLEILPTLEAGSVDAVITGNVGPKAFTTLQAANVKAYIGAAGSVSDTVEQLKAGRLDCAGKPNVEGHWQ